MVDINEMVRIVTVTVQVVAALGMIAAIVIAAWQLKLQRKEVIKQNQKIINLLTKVSNTLIRIRKEQSKNEM